MSIGLSSSGNFLLYKMVLNISFVYSVKAFDDQQESRENDEENRELSVQLEDESVNQ